MDLCKVVGVDVSTLNNNKNMNLEGYKRHVGSYLTHCRGLKAYFPTIFLSKKSQKTLLIA
jgi:hypothetical protein